MIDKYTYLNYNMLLLAACAIKLWVIEVVAVTEFGIRDIVLDIGKKNPVITFKLELIEIDFLLENESITISIVLSNSHDNYRLNWNDLDANWAKVNNL